MEYKRQNKKRPPLYEKAGITIYISMVLVVILALTCTLIESGRVSAIRARARSSVFMAADSAFAEFAQPVFDRYGVMFLWMEEEEFRKTFQRYIETSLDLKGTGAGADLDLYGLKLSGSSMKGAKRITDAGGTLFAEQICDYMKVHAVEGIAETLLSRSDLFRQTEKAREIFGKISSFQEEFAKVEENAVKIYESTQRIKDLSENPKTILDQMEKALSDPEEKNLKEQLKKSKKEWQQTEQHLQKEVAGLKEETADYSRNVEETKDVTKAMQEEFDLDEDSFDPEIYKALHNKMEQFEELGSEEGEQYRQIMQNAENAEDWLHTVKTMDDYFDRAEEALAENDLEGCRDLTETFKEQMKMPELSVKEGLQSDALAERPSVGFIRTIRKQQKKGILDLFADKISDKQVETKDLPSVTCEQKNTDGDDVSFGEAAMQKALFCEYIREHFNCFTKQKRETALDYEMEYILAGKNNDRDNLSAVVAELVLLRSGANIVGLLMDGTKRAQIEGLALSIAGASTQVYLTKIIELLILTVWAVAEAMMDVRSLLEGKRVAILKREGDWNISLEGLQNYAGVEESGKDSKTGLNYEEYLLILLILQGKTQQYFRSMDVIQMNMCAEETEQFRIKDCLVSVQVEAEFTAPGIFTSLLPVRSLLRPDEEGYRFTFLQDYAY